MTVIAHSIDGDQLDKFELQLPSGASLEALRELSPARAARIDGL